MLPSIRNFRLTCLAFFLIALPLQSQEKADRDAYEIKAAWLINFIRYVEWPKPVFPNDRLAIVVLGKEPKATRFGDQNLNVRGVKIDIIYRTTLTVDDLKNCHLLFIARSKRKEIKNTLALVDQRPILTVCENKGFLTKGGMINFIVKGETILFEISQKNADKNGLRITSHLLARAHFVEKADGGHR